MELEIRPLTPERLEDYLAFFDRDAFTDNEHWAGCYCYFNHFPGTQEQWMERTGAQNRAAVSDLVVAGRMRGYLAYAGDRVVGWCNANDRAASPMYSSVPELAGDGTLRVCAVTCYVVRPDARRQGVARALLRAACAGARAEGFDVVEAYPRLGAEGTAANYHGPLALYESEGFVTFAEQHGIRAVRLAMK